VFRDVDHVVLGRVGGTGLPVVARQLQPEFVGVDAVDVDPFEGVVRGLERVSPRDVDVAERGRRDVDRPVPALAVTLARPAGGVALGGPVVRRPRALLGRVGEINERVRVVYGRPRRPPARPPFSASTAPRRAAR
jgi:hypothetical protein